MQLDHLLLAIHVLAVAVWIGAALALQVIASRVKQSTADAVVDQFAADAEAIGKRLFAPASILLLASGVALVMHEHLSFGRLWIVLGIAAMLVAGAVGGAFLIPDGRRLAELARQPGHDQSELRRRTRRRFLVARIDLTVLVLAVVDMVFRPGR